MSGIWNQSLADKNTRLRNGYQNNANSAFSIISNIASSVALNIPGAAEQMNGAKQSVYNSVNSMRGLNADVKATIDRIDINGLEFRIKQARQELAETKASMGKKKQILDLRKEQAESLKRKYEGNFHSSWLGLMRPLADEGRVGLGVAAGIFGFLALISIGYLVFVYYGARSGGGSNGSFAIPAAAPANSANVFGAMMGGLRRLK